MVQISRQWPAIFGYSTALIVYFRFMSIAEAKPQAIIPKSKKRLSKLIAHPNNSGEAGEEPTRKRQHSRSRTIPASAEARAMVTRISALEPPTEDANDEAGGSANASTSSLIEIERAWIQRTFYPSFHDYNSDKDSYFTESEQHKILLALWTFHYGRRLIETLFISEYKSTDSIIATIVGSVYYGVVAWMNSPSKRDIFTDTKRHYLHKNIALIGSITFFIGEIGNAYHHYLLKGLKNDRNSNSISNNSSNNSEGTRYVMPRGGMFEYVSTPHYFFELISWLGWSIVNTFSAGSVSFLFASSIVLAFKASQRHERNIMAFGDSWPKDRKALIPFVW